jgi:hypothetical protein
MADVADKGARDACSTAATGHFEIFRDIQGCSGTFRAGRDMQGGTEPQEMRSDKRDCHVDGREEQLGRGRAAEADGEAATQMGT